MVAIGARARRSIGPAASLAVLVLVIGCRAASTDDTGPNVADGRSADDRTATPCASADPGTVYEDWDDADDVAAELVPLIVSSQVGVGPNRLLYTVMDSGYDPLASADTPTRLRLYALDRGLVEPTLEADGTFLDTGTGRGLYRATVSFDCPGTWGAEISLHPGTDLEARTRTVFRVTDADSTPAIGAEAPRSTSLTASTMDEVRGISTDPEPDLLAYRSTVAEAVTSGKPAVIFFATPAFCQSGVCGPTVDMVKDVMSGYRGVIEFVNVEPYKLRRTANGLQPELDDQGRLQPVQAVLDYGIAVEPYLFVVDGDGRVAAKFEVVVGEDELRGALEDVLLSSSAT